MAAPLGMVISLGIGMRSQYRSTQQHLHGICLLTSQLRRKGCRRCNKDLVTNNKALNFPEKQDPGAGIDAGRCDNPASHEQYAQENKVEAHDEAANKMPLENYK